MSGLTALVLAGSRAGGDPLADYAGVSHKALIDIGGRSMIECVIAALSAVPRIGRIVIAIERPELIRDLPGLRAPACAKPVLTMPTGSGPSDSVAAALAMEGTPLFVTTGDHPLLQPEWIERFLDDCPADADVTAALAGRAAITAAVPGTQRTWLRFSDGDFSGCNLFFMARPAASGVARLWQQIEAERKHPLRMVLRLGAGHALRYKLGQLSLAQALARLGELSGARVGRVILPYGLSAVDVDKPADLDLVREVVARGSAQLPR